MISEANDTKPLDRDTLLQEQEQLQLRALAHRNKFLRESVDIWDQIVDPMDAVRDEEGLVWNVVGDNLINDANPFNQPLGFRTLTEFRIARNQCRWLWKYNPFAKCAHENRVSYTVGIGHTYKVVPKHGINLPPDKVLAVQRVLDAFLKANRWSARQKETLQRVDRDGECFLRSFIGPDGATRVRFIESVQVVGNPDDTAPFGVKHDPDDVETVLGYYVSNDPTYSSKPDFVPAENIQHRKANVDCNVSRGVPLFFPVRENLRRASKLLRNMVATSDIQTSIALIRKHQNMTRSAAETFVANKADYTAQNPITGKTKFLSQYQPGSILDAAATTEYQFPNEGLNAANYVAVLAAELRGIASRLVMPEFMLTADASNANLASTMVAEGPAVKMFERLQNDTKEHDLEVMDRVLANAELSGKLERGLRELIEIQVGLPNVLSREQLKESQASNIQFAAGVLSAQTWCAQSGTDYEQELENIKQYHADLKDAGLPVPTPLPTPIDASGDPTADGLEPRQPQPQPGAQEPDATGSQQVKVSQAAVLNGAQIAAATGIVTAVASGAIPRDAGLGQLEILFNLSREQAEALLGSAGTNAPTTPNPRPANAQSIGGAQLGAAKGASTKAAVESAQSLDELKAVLRDVISE